MGGGPGLGRVFFCVGRMEDEGLQRLGLEGVKIAAVDGGDVADRVGGEKEGGEQKGVLVLRVLGLFVVEPPSHIVNAFGVVHRKEHSFLAIVGTVVVGYEATGVFVLPVLQFLV